MARSALPAWLAQPAAWLAPPAAWLAPLVACLVQLATAGLPLAAELLMVEKPGCPWCARWNAEIGPIYPKTAEAARAPLRRVDLSLGWPEDLAAIQPERVTPTFILVENGVEFGRLRGYPGEDFFWGYMTKMIEALERGQGQPPTSRKEPSS